MTFSEKLELESPLCPVSFFHQEGAYWVAYEYSAFRFMQEIDGTVPVKIVTHPQNKKKIISISVSRARANELDAILPLAHIADDLVAISSGLPFNEQEYDRWKKKYI